MSETIDHWRQYLTIDKLDLDSCLVEQPETYWHVSHAVANAIAVRDAAKLDLEEIQAEEDKKLRDAASRSEEKITEAALQQKLRLVKRVQDAQRKFLDTRKEADEWLALKEAFSQRSFMLRELVAITIAQRHDHAMEGGSGQSRAKLADSNRQEAGRLRRAGR